LALLGGQRCRTPEEYKAWSQNLGHEHVQPGLRPKWRAADEVRETSQSGRRGVGTVNHCMHGPHAIIEEVLDWRPFDYLTISTLLPMPDAPKVIM